MTREKDRSPRGPTERTLVGAALRAGYRAASRLLYGRGDYADWAYERMQRPASAVAMAGNMALRAARVPRVTSFVSMAIEPAFQCNLRCRTCRGRYDMEGLRPKLMPWELFRRAVDEAPPSVESVVFAMAGEPLLNPRLPEMIDHVAASGRRALLVTNGTLLDGEVADRVARSRLSVLTMSVETDAEMARQVRGVDHEELRRKLERFAARKHPLTALKLSVVAHPENEHRLGRLWEEFAGLVEDIKVSPCISLEEAGSRTTCTEPWRGNLCVFTSGDVTPCCFDLRGDLSFGNLNDRRFDEILAGPGVTRVLSMFTSGPMADRCARCHQFLSPHLPRRISR